ncbi:MAG: PspC domain-containing protein [Methanosarcinaceae archaeon]|nr:PspC domain-containing protein [Methanosarcinaceae archaeon]
MRKRLYRSKRNRMIGGVCGGVGEYFNVDPTFVRLLWVLFTFAYGSGVLAYIIAWVIIPEHP